MCTNATVLYKQLAAAAGWLGPVALLWSVGGMNAWHACTQPGAALLL